jgi:hypothetical protein
MKSTIIWLACILAIWSACRNKETNEPAEGFISAVSIIREQVKHVDTSLYMILKLTYKDTVYGDTEYIRREDFASHAKDFLELPDITQKEYADKYTEEKIYDTSIQRAIFIYRPKDPAGALIQRQEIVVTPDLFGGESRITSIIIETSFQSRDSAVHKKLLWQNDRSFQVTKIVQKNAEPETTHSFKVSWNEEKDL